MVWALFTYSCSIAPGEESGDDRARAGAGEKIKHIAQDKPGVAALRAKYFLDPPEHLEGENPPDAAAVEGEDAFHGAS